MFILWADMDLYKHLVLRKTYEKILAATWGSGQGAMFECVLKASCENIEYGWTKDRAPVDTFVPGIPSGSMKEHSMDLCVEIQWSLYDDENIGTENDILPRDSTVTDVEPSISNEDGPPLLEKSSLDAP
ncbi:Armadillo-type fold [Artemisia annua]|uniref:Armadillo-type fold n=1 Tax=Artemisia annua TaxID=35608 RepID=A0A2U1P5D3_ARTAN|nr:Armadillo-type fold [Artemisia annua]